LFGLKTREREPHDRLRASPHSLQGDAERELALRVPGLALDPARARSSIAAATSLARNASTPRRNKPVADAAFAAASFEEPSCMQRGLRADGR
jgi:hypothetical protein